MANLFNKKKLNTHDIQSLNYLAKAPLNNLICNFEELEKLLYYLKENKLNMPENIYFCMINFHSILYKEDKTINIESYNNKIELSNLFFLNLLIMDNINLINYEYSFDFIKSIFDSNKNGKSLQKILVSKIIIGLLKNYKGLKNYQEETKEKVDELKEQNEKIIKDNINDLKKIDSSFNDDYIKNKKIDELYIEIIRKLIISKKFEDDKYINDIMNQLDMEKIHLSNKMFEKLSEILNESNLKDYTISNKNDLLEEKKINFYYLLFKYILKNTFFVYLNGFLLKIRKIIIELLQKKEIIMCIIKNEKLKYILQFFFFFFYNYYYDQFNELLIYYKRYKFEKKKKDIDKIESLDENNKVDELKEYFKDYKEAKSKNVYLGIINSLFNAYFKEERTENNFNEMVEKWDVMQKIIKDEKRTKMRDDDCLVFIKYFNDISNKESFYRIFNEKSRNFLFDYLNKKIKLYKSDYYLCSVPYYIINKSTFEFHINEKGKEPYIIYEKINYGFFNFEIKYDEIKLIKENKNFKNSEDKIIIDNYNKFFNFLKQVEDGLKNEFKYNYNLKMSLDFKMENKKNNDNVYNVTCIYTFSEPIKNIQYRFKENNIFINGIKSEGFKNLLSAINNESYKEVKYQ